MLRFPEEIMLLLLDDEGGDFVRVPEWSVQCALAGAVLMDLALENRIDTDPNWLTVIDPTPVGDDLLDPTLERITQADGERDTRFWIQDIAQRAGPDPRAGAGTAGGARHPARRATRSSCGCSSRGATRRWTARPTAR